MAIPKVTPAVASAAGTAETAATTALTSGAASASTSADTSEVLGQLAQSAASQLQISLATQQNSLSAAVGNAFEKAGSTIEKASTQQ